MPLSAILNPFGEFFYIGTPEFHVIRQLNVINRAVVQQLFDIIFSTNCSQRFWSGEGGGIKHPKVKRKVWPTVQLWIVYKVLSSVFTTNFPRRNIVQDRLYTLRLAFRT